MSDEPDILAWENASEVILIVECTIGVPADHKLTMLISRVARLRESLRNARDIVQSLETLAFLVCPLPPEEVLGMRRKAQVHSIGVLCRPEIEQAIERSKFAPDPAGMLKSWRELPWMQLLTGHWPAQSLDG